MMPIAQVLSPLLLFVFSQLSESAYLGKLARFYWLKKIYSGNEAEKLRNSSATCDWFGLFFLKAVYLQPQEPRRFVMAIVRSLGSRPADPPTASLTMGWLATVTRLSETLVSLEVRPSVAGKRFFCLSSAIYNPDTSDCNKRGKWMSSLNTQYSCESDRPTYGMAPPSCSRLSCAALNTGVSRKWGKI